MPLTINDLPDSILLKIFSILSSRRLYTLFRLRSVCRKWKAFASDSDLWRRIVFPDKMFFEMEVLERLITWCDNVVEVDISNSTNRGDYEWLELIATKCPNIHILKAKHCSINDEGVRKLAYSCTKLRELVLSCRSPTSGCFIDILRNCPRLESLHIFHQDDENGTRAAFQLSNEFIKSLLTSNIKSFCCQLPGFSSEGAFMMGNYITCQSSKLEKLDLSGSSTLTDQMLMFIASKCPKLKSLNISHCSNVSEFGMIGIATVCPLLETIITNNAGGNMLLATMTTGAVEALTTNCKNLQSLDLTTGNQRSPATNGTLQLIAAKCPTLKHLSVSGCCQITDEGIIAIANSCKFLTSLNISFCKMTDASLKAIAEKSNNLEKLVAYLCRNLTAAGIKMVARRCLKLRQLWLHLNYDLTGLNFTSEHHSALYIEDLNLMNTNITNECIENITSVCPNLAKLNLSQCHNITDQALVSIGQNSSDIKVLKIAFCHFTPSCFTTAGLSTLATKLHNLEAIDMTWCLNADYDCLKVFIEECPFLSEVLYSKLTGYDKEFYHNQKDELADQLEEELEQVILDYRNDCCVDIENEFDISGKTALSFTIRMSSMFP